MTCGFHRSGECEGGGGSSGRFREGVWRSVNVAANFNAVIGRATSQPTAVEVPRSRLVGFTCSMDNLGLVNAVAGSPLLIKVIRTSAAGVADAAVTVASIGIGESNVTRETLVEILFEGGDSAHVQLTTDGSWSNLTCDPSIQLEFERR